MRSAEDYLVVLIIVWLICGVVAGAAGPSRYSGRLFFLTVLFLGPLGIAVALITKAIEDYAAPSGPRPATPIAPISPLGRAPADVAAPPAPPTVDKRTVTCPLCGAEQRIPSTAERFTCGRCKKVSTI